MYLTIFIIIFYFEMAYQSTASDSSFLPERGETDSIVDCLNHEIGQCASLKRIGRSAPVEILEEDLLLETGTEESTDSDFKLRMPWNLTEIAMSPSFEALDQYLPDTYNKFEIPAFPTNITGGRRFRVWVSINIRSILEIDELKERITLQMETVISWFDYHIYNKHKDTADSNSTKPLDLLYLEKIWKPDLYMENLVHMGRPSFIGEPISLRLRPKDGEVFYKARLSPVVKCSMTFMYYPADTQKCQFILRSYSYQSQDLDLHWLRIVNLNESDVASFELHIETVVKRSNITEMFDTLDLTYDTITFTLTARRLLSYHIIQTYFPSSLFIIITWFCFLLPPSMLEARMGIAMTTLLTLTAMFASVRGNAPVVAYVKAIDIWMAGCILFVFVSLAEFTAMIWVRTRRQLDEEAMTKKAKHLHPHRGNDADERDKESEPFVENKMNSADNRGNKNFLPLYEIVGELLEKVAIYVYSVSFLIFTIVYWTWLLVSAKYFETPGTGNASIDYAWYNYENIW